MARIEKKLLSVSFAVANFEAFDGVVCPTDTHANVYFVLKEV